MCIAKNNKDKSNMKLCSLKSSTVLIVPNNVVLNERHITTVLDERHITSFTYFKYTWLTEGVDTW